MTTSQLANQMTNQLTNQINQMSLVANQTVGQINPTNPNPRQVYLLNPFEMLVFQRLMKYLQNKKRFDSTARCIVQCIVHPLQIKCSFR